MTVHIHVHTRGHTLDFAYGMPLSYSRFGTLYAGYPVAEASNVALRAWMLEQGFDPSSCNAGELHVTVAESRTKIDRHTLPPPRGGLVIPPGGRRIEQFGDVLVLCVRSPELDARNKEYEAMGARWPFPVYQPHITLGGADGLPPRGSILPFNEPITLGPEERTAFD
jgi:hypothetical protein